MSEVVDFMAFKARRHGQSLPRSALADCLTNDTLTDLTTLVDRLSECESLSAMYLSDCDKYHLDMIAVLCDEYLDSYELLGLNLVEEELTN